VCKDKEEKKKCVIKSRVKVAVLTEGSCNMSGQTIESHQASDCICCGVGITYFSAKLRFAAIL